ncbi:MAG: arginase family protein [Candidatus Woesearchaeota archaeon]
MILVQADTSTPELLDHVKANLNESLKVPLIHSTSLQSFEESPSFEELPVFVGKDHTLTARAFQLFSKNFSKPGIIMFDAHLDLIENKTVRTLIDTLKVPPENILVVGARSIRAAELASLRQTRLKVYPMREIISEGIQNVCDSVMSVAKNFGALFVSIDLDVVDPIFAPAVLAKEPAGMSSRELIYFIQRLKLLRNLKAFDVMGFLPEKDTQEITLKLLVKIVQEAY